MPETGTLSDLSMPEGGSVTKHSYTTSDGQTFSFNIQWPTSFTQVVDRKWQTFDNYNPEAWTTEELTNQTYYSDLNNNQNTSLKKFSRNRGSQQWEPFAIAHCTITVKREAYHMLCMFKINQRQRLIILTNYSFLR